MRVREDPAFLAWRDYLREIGVYADMVGIARGRGATMREVYAPGRGARHVTAARRDCCVLLAESFPEMSVRRIGRIMGRDAKMVLTYLAGVVGRRGDGFGQAGVVPGGGAGEAVGGAGDGVPARRIH